MAQPRKAAPKAAEKPTSPLSSLEAVKRVASKAASLQESLKRERDSQGRPVIFEPIHIKANTVAYRDFNSRPNGSLGQHDFNTVTVISLPMGTPEELQKEYARISEETGVDYSWILQEIDPRSGQIVQGNQELAYSRREQSLFRCKWARDVSNSYMNEPEMWMFSSGSLVWNDKAHPLQIRLMRMHNRNVSSPFAAESDRRDATFKEVMPAKEAMEKNKKEIKKLEFMDIVYQRPIADLIGIAVVFGVSPDILSSVDDEKGSMLRKAIVDSVGNGYEKFLEVFSSPDLEFYANYQMAKLVGKIRETNGDLYYERQDAPFTKLGAGSPMQIMEAFAAFAKSDTGAKEYQRMLSLLDPFKS